MACLGEVNSETVPYAQGNLDWRTEFTLTQHSFTSQILTPPQKVLDANKLNYIAKANKARSRKNKIRC